MTVRKRYLKTYLIETYVYFQFYSSYTYTVFASHISNKLEKSYFEPYIKMIISQGYTPGDMTHNLEETFCPFCSVKFFWYLLLQILMN